MRENKTMSNFVMADLENKGHSGLFTMEFVCLMRIQINLRICK